MLDNCVTYDCPVTLSARRRGAAGDAMVYIAGKPFASARSHVRMCPDPEKLATLISIKRALAMAARFPVPQPVPALLQLAAKLLELRLQAQMQGGAKAADAKKRFAALLGSAKKSPVKAVRAFAVGLEEWLK